MSFETWNTENEIEFLMQLGMHSPLHDNDRLQLLRKYLSSAKHRSNWGRIDSQVVIDYVLTEICNFNKN